MSVKAAIVPAYNPTMIQHEKITAASSLSPFRPLLNHRFLMVSSFGFSRTGMNGIASLRLVLYLWGRELKEHHLQSFFVFPSKLANVTKRSSGKNRSLMDDREVVG